MKAVSGANTEVYSYDALGRRITAKLNNNTATDLYFSAAWQVLEEDAGTMQNQYVWSALYVDALVEGDLGGTRYYVQQDANWNVTAIVGTTGTVQERFTYDPYGQPSYYTAGWGSTTNNGWSYQFQGGRYDSTSGLYNFRTRDLSSSLGRWMEQDPIGYAAGDSNLYGYEGSAPTESLDPTGEIPPLLIFTAAALGVLLGPDYLQNTSQSEPVFMANPGAATLGGTIRGTTAVMLPFSRPIQVAGAALFSYDYANQEAAQLENWLNGRPVRPYSWSRGFDTVLTYGLSGPFFNAYPVLYGPALGLGMESARYHSERGEYAQMAVDVAAVTGGLHGVRDVVVYTEKGPIPLSELAPETCPAASRPIPQRLVRGGWYLDPITGARVRPGIYDSGTGKLHIGEGEAGHFGTARATGLADTPGSQLSGLAIISHGGKIYFVQHSGWFNRPLTSAEQAAVALGLGAEFGLPVVYGTPPIGGPINRPGGAIPGNP